MWRFTGDISFACDSCGNASSIPIEDFEYDSNSYERGMGPEHMHILSFEANCGNCKQNLRVEFEVSEYPLGCINHVETNHGGILECSTPDTEYYPEIYSIEDAFEHRSEDIAALMAILESDPRLVKNVRRFEFEDVVAKIFENQGFRVEQTKRTRDGGKDIIAFSIDSAGQEKKYFIECKHPDEGNKVGVSLVREVYGVHNTKNGPDKTILVTTSRFTGPAKSFVENEIRVPWELELKDYDDVLRMLEGK